MPLRPFLASSPFVDHLLHVALQLAHGSSDRAHVTGEAHDPVGQDEREDHARGDRVKRVFEGHRVSRRSLGIIGEGNFAPEAWVKGKRHLRWPYQDIGTERRTSRSNDEQSNLESHLVDVVIHDCITVLPLVLDHVHRDPQGFVPHQLVVRLHRSDVW